jgi:hypothetical protein
MTRRFYEGPMSTFAAASVVALSGCGSEESPTKKAAPNPPKPSAATVPEDLVGTWQGRPPNWRKVNGDKLVAERLRARVRKGLPPGYYTMKLARDGTVEMYDPGSNTDKECLHIAHGCDGLQVKASRWKLLIGDTLECAEPAEYSYKLRGGKLTTKRVKDDCGSDRPQLFNGTTWRRQP